MTFPPYVYISAIAAEYAFSCARSNCTCNRPSVRKRRRALWVLAASEVFCARGFFLTPYNKVKVLAAGSSLRPIKCLLLFVAPISAMCNRSIAKLVAKPARCAQHSVANLYICHRCS